jgi:hypothetical protein
MSREMGGGREMRSPGKLGLDRLIPHALQEVLLKAEIVDKPFIFNMFHAISLFNQTVDSGEKRLRGLRIQEFRLSTIVENAVDNSFLAPGADFWRFYCKEVFLFE